MQELVTFGTIAVGLVTATLALLGLIVTKETKVSEFRQLWINDLRNDVAELIGNLLSVLTILDIGDEPVERSEIDIPNDQKSEARKLLNLSNAAMSRIRMRLNRNEKASIALLTTIDEAENLSNDWDRLASGNVISGVNDLERRLIKETSDILSLEWKRVKAGEPIFQTAQRSIRAICKVSLAAIVTIAVATLLSLAGEIDSGFHRWEQSAAWQR